MLQQLPVMKHTPCHLCCRQSLVQRVGSACYAPMSAALNEDEQYDEENCGEESDVSPCAEWTQDGGEFFLSAVEGGDEDGGIGLGLVRRGGGEGF